MTVRKSRSEAYTYLSSLRKEGYTAESNVDSRDNLNITAERVKNNVHVKYVIVHTNNGWLKLTKYVNGNQNGTKRKGKNKE